MDALDRLLDAGRDLLGLVDAALTAGGVPAGHPFLAGVRRVGALPGAAVDSLAEMRPEPLLDRARQLSAVGEGYEAQRAALAGLVGAGVRKGGGVREGGVWEGGGAEAFAAQVRAFAAHLGRPGEESLIGRLDATVSYLSELADWIAESRYAVAEALAAAMGSAEAVHVRAAAWRAAQPGGPDPAVAAAAIGSRLLDAVARALDTGQAVRESWVGRLGELEFRAPQAADPAVFGTGTRAVL